MPRPFARLRALLEKLAFAGLKPEERPLPGPMTLRHKIAVLLGIILVGVFVFVLIGFLRKPAEQKEADMPPPPPVEIVPPGLKVEKNKDLEVTELDLNVTHEPKVITGTLRN